MRTLILLTCLLLAACAEQVQPPPKAGDVHALPPVEWRVVDRPTLERIYRDAGMPIPEGRELRGFVGTQGGRTVIYTQPPRNVDDDVATTLGHEVMHLALGNYHR